MQSIWLQFDKELWGKPQFNSFLIQISPRRMNVFLLSAAICCVLCIKIQVGWKWNIENYFFTPPSTCVWYLIELTWFFIRLLYTTNHHQHHRRSFSTLLTNDSPILNRNWSLLCGEERSEMDKIYFICFGQIKNISFFTCGFWGRVWVSE